MPSFDGFPGRSRRSFRLTRMFSPRLTQTMTPLLRNILCPMCTLMRKQSTLFTLVSIIERRLPNIVLGLVLLVPGARRRLGQSCSTAGWEAGKPGGSEMNS